MPPPGGIIFMPPAWTIQQAGVKFDPPAPITIPNNGLPPGRVIDIFQFDHTLNQFINVGKGTVSEDGSVITSDPGFGITAAGWGGGGPPPPPTTCGGTCDDGNVCTTDSCQNGQCVNAPITDCMQCEIRPLTTPFPQPHPHPVDDFSCSTAIALAGFNCMQQEVVNLGGTSGVRSVCRPQAAQDHLGEVWNKKQTCDGNTNPQCTQICADIRSEIAVHSLGDASPPVNVSYHTLGNAFDLAIGGLPEGQTRATVAATCAARGNVTINVGKQTHFTVLP